MFLAKSFQVPVEPVKNSDVVVTDRPFIPPTQQPTGVTGEKQSSSAASKMDVKKATQPVEVPGVVLATWPVEAPGAAPVTHTTGQKADLSAAFDRPEVQPPGPAVQPSTTTSKQSATSLPGSTVPDEEPAVESDHFSDQASSLAGEGEASDLESTSPDRKELLEVDQELTAEQTYRETLRGVRSFMAWNDIPEFDSSSSSQDDNPVTGSKSFHTGKVSVKVPVDEWLVNACVTGKEACSVNSSTGSKNCVNATEEELYTGSQDCFITCKEDLLRTLTVNSSVANHVHFVSGLPQKKGVIPNYCHLYPEIKHVQGVSCVNQSSSVQNVTNFHLLYQIYL